MIGKITKKIYYIINALKLKIKYGKRIIYKKEIFSINIESPKEIAVNKGNIIFEGNVKISKNSKIISRDLGIIKFGNNCYINNNFICVSHLRTEIGNDVSIGPNCCIFDHNHSFNENGQIHGEYKKEKVIIGNNVWIGAGVTILKGTEIGNNCVIGAGTVVKGIIPPNSIVTNNRQLIVKPLEKNNKANRIKNEKRA